MVNADSGTVRLIEVDVMGKLAEETDADADPALPRRMSAILTLEKPSQGRQKAIIVWHAAQCPLCHYHPLSYLPDSQLLSQCKHLRKTSK